MKLTPVLLAMSWLLVSTAAQSDDDIIVLGGVSSTAPVVVERKSPIYPVAARQEGVEGWVYLQMTVGVDGSPHGIQVTQSSIDEVFDKAAIDAMKAWVFEPATEQGEPVEAQFEVRHSFLLEGHQGTVSDRFYRQARGISAALDDGKLKKALKNIELLERDRIRLLAEEAYLDYFKAVYFEKTGDPEEALKQLNMALRDAKHGVSTSVYGQMLRSAVRLNATMGNLGSALERYAALQALPGDFAADDATTSLVAQIESLVEGNQVLEFEAVLKACENCVGGDYYDWEHRPVRNRFSVPEVPETVAETRLQCGNAFHYFQLEPGKTYVIPELSDDCYLRVKGTQAASFSFLALPDNDQPAVDTP